MGRGTGRGIRCGGWRVARRGTSRKVHAAGTPVTAGTAATAATAATVVLLLASCGAATGGAPEAVAVPPPSAEVLCNDLGIPRAALEDPTPATRLGPDGLESLRGVEVPPVEDLASWSVAAEGPDGVVLVRELPAPLDDDTGAPRTHEVLATQPSSDPAGNGWFLLTAGPCALREPLPDGLGDADLSLDPGDPPGETEDSLRLLLMERECASGQDAVGRVELVRLVETAAAVEVVLGVRPVEGGATCPGNPPTPFVVPLGAPLGERAVRDASTVPVRTLAAGTPVPLDCSMRGEVVSAHLDYAAGSPGLPGDPAAAVRAWASGGLTLDDRLDVRRTAAGPSATVARVTVERAGRAVGRVSLEAASDGGLLVAGYEACSADDPFA